MSDYSEAVVYKIYKEDISEFYIGSTKNEKQREQRHKSNCNNENNHEYNYKVYIFMRENGGWDKWNLEVIEIYPCDNEEQLRIREQYYYDLLKPTLNSQRPFITKEDMKEDMKEYNAKYREELKEDMKEYRKDHKDDVKAYNAKYREENRDEILKYNNQKNICECGGKYTTVGKSQHCKTKKHITFIENNKLKV